MHRFACCPFLSHAFAFATIGAMALWLVTGCEKPPSAESESAPKERGTEPNLYESAHDPLAAQRAAAEGEEPVTRPPIALPDGLELIPVNADEVLKVIHAPGAKAVVFNAWATWCPPCMEEFPSVLKVYRKYQNDGLRMVFVSADEIRQRAAALEFLASAGVDFRTYVISEWDDDEFIESVDPAWNGTLPTTFVYGGDGTLYHRIEAPITEAQLDALVAPILAGVLPAPLPSPPADQAKSETPPEHKHGH